MKTKTLLFSLLAFIVFTLSSCGPNNEEYADKVVGNYNITITPYLTVKYEGQALPVTIDEIKTTCSITKANADDDGSVIMKINGINGVINDIVMNGYCSGLGLKLEDSKYDGFITTENNDRIECDIILKNTTASISNAKVLNWNSTVTGKCEINYIGLDITCDVTGTINYYATMIIE
ncbi:MAG: hypothetical protein IKU01_09905 [Bacteroidales bacterium]|nr:hypothetical protein [Bacteroidales bacterium]